MADQPEICIITTATWQHVGTCCSDSVWYLDIAGASQWLIFWRSLSYTRAVKFLILGYLLISGYILGCFLIFLPSLLATSIPLSLPFPSSRLYKLENSPKWGGTSPKMEKAVRRIPVYTVIAAHLVLRTSKSGGEQGQTNGQSDAPWFACQKRWLAETALQPGGVICHHYAFRPSAEWISRKNIRAK